MKNDLPVELIYGLVFAAIVLFQYLLKRFGPQEPQDPARDLPEMFDDVAEIPAADSVSSVDFGQFGRARAPGAAAATPAGRRFARATLMGSRRDLQNAVVIATILGRCRAFEPHEIR